MKKNTTIILIVLLVILVAIAGTLTLRGDLFQGRLELDKPILKFSEIDVSPSVVDVEDLPDLTISFITNIPMLDLKNIGLGSRPNQDFKVVISYESGRSRPFEKTVIIQGQTSILGHLALDENAWASPGIVITATIDAENVIPESNEANNTAVYKN